MKELLEFLVKELVSKPEEVIVTEHEDGKCIILTVSTNPDDTGKVIGKNGKVANAIRVLIRSLSKSSRKFYVVKIKEN